MKTKLKTMALRPGDLVKYISPYDKAEKESCFKLIELNGDRGFMELVCAMPIPPVILFRTDEICRVEGDI